MLLLSPVVRLRVFYRLCSACTTTLRRSHALPVAEDHDDVSLYEKCYDVRMRVIPSAIEVGLGLCWGMLIIPGCIKERTAKGFVCGDVRCTLGMHAYFELLRNSPHCVSNNTHEVLRNAVLLSIPVTGLIDILSAREIQHD